MFIKYQTVIKIFPTAGGGGGEEGADGVSEREGSTVQCTAK